MSEAFDFGKAAEDAAADYLQKNTYRIITRNYRYQKAEIDIFAAKGNFLISAEVKARSRNRLQAPEEAVTKKKIKMIVSATQHFLEEHPEFEEVRFDIISVILSKEGFVIEHLEDAFHAWDAE